MSTYAISVTRPFIRGFDPQRKLLRRDGADWCQDALDVLVYAGQRVCLGETFVRRYAATAAPPSRRAGSPPAPGQVTALLDIYRTDSAAVKYTTDSGLSRCGTLELDIDQAQDLERSGTSWKSEVELRVSFGSDELRLCAVDRQSGRCVLTKVKFNCQ